MSKTPETSLPLTFAAIPDGRRRGGFRVARCRVVVALSGGLDAAFVREVQTRAEHWRPLAALAKGPRRAGRIVRALRAAPPPFTPPPEEAQSAVAQTLAGTTGGSVNPAAPQWWQRD